MARGKKDNTLYWVLGIGLLLLLFYGGQNGWFQQQTFITESTTNTYNPQAAQNQNVPSTTQSQTPAKNQTQAPLNSSVFIALANLFNKPTPVPNLQPVPLLPLPLCVDSDNGQDYFTAGTCTTDGASYDFDQCVGSQVKEYYCSSTGESCRYTTQPCVMGLACYAGKCVVLCEYITDPTSASDCENHPTSDGGVCAYWAGMGKCLSSF